MCYCRTKYDYSCTSDSAHFTGSVISLRVNTESSQFSYFTARRDVSDNNENTGDITENEKREREGKGVGEEKGEMTDFIWL